MQTSLENTLHICVYIYIQKFRKAKKKFKLNALAFDKPITQNPIIQNHDSHLIIQNRNTKDIAKCKKPK